MPWLWHASRCYLRDWVANHASRRLVPNGGPGVSRERSDQAAEAPRWQGARPPQYRRYFKGAQHSQRGWIGGLAPVS